VGTFNAVISACREGAQTQRALALFTQMQEAPHYLRPDQATYSCLFSVLERSGDWEIALDLFEEMQASDMAIDAIAYSAALSAVLSFSDTSPSSSTSSSLVPALALYSSIPPPLCSSSCFNSLLRSALRLGDWEVALRVLEDMGRSGSDRVWDQTTLGLFRGMCDQAPENVIPCLSVLAEKEILPSEACQVFDIWQRAYSVDSWQSAWSGDSWSNHGYYRGSTNSSVCRPTQATRTSPSGSKVDDVKSTLPLPAVLCSQEYVENHEESDIQISPVPVLYTEENLRKSHMKM